MGSRTPDNRPWGSEKVRGMIAAGRWSDAQIARYVGTHTESQVASIRKWTSEQAGPPTAYLPSHLGLDLHEERKRRAEAEAANSAFLARLRKLGDQAK